VDDQQVGSAIRRIRIRQRKTQEDVASIARVSRFVVARIERGRLASVPVAKVRAVASALDARLDLVVRWQGGDLGRLLNARHSAMHDAVAAIFDGLDGWVVDPEVSFSEFGERGIIDVLAWHPEQRSLLVIELKTELVDINELMGSLDRKRRLAPDVVRRRGWYPAHVSSWVVIAEGTTNRRRAAGHQATLRAKFPSDGRSIATWLRSPSRRIDALSFLPYVHGAHLSHDMAPVRRVRRRSSSAGRAQGSLGRRAGEPESTVSGT
jgi:transcriptional regulator with XRE-family HTH domain